MWGQILGAVAGPLLGAFLDKDSAKSPSAPPPIDLEELARMMMLDTSSPWGGTSYEQGPDGRWSANYGFSDQVQPSFDRLAERGANSAQAYQMPGQLRQLQQALMNQRVGQMGMTPDAGYGPTPRPERRPTGGGGFSGPFGGAGSVAPAQQGNARALRGGAGQVGGFGGQENSPGRGGGFGGGSGDYDIRSGGMGALGAYGTNAHPFSRAPTQEGFNSYLNRKIPGAQQGWDPNKFQQWGLENAGHLGTAASAATGIPGLKLVGEYFANRHMRNNPWQSPISGQNIPGENIPPPPPSGNDMINRSVDGLSNPIGGGTGGGLGEGGGPTGWAGNYGMPYGGQSGVGDMLGQGSAFWNGMFGWLGGGGSGGGGGQRLMLPIIPTESQ